MMDFQLFVKIVFNHVFNVKIKQLVFLANKDFIYFNLAV